MQFVHDAPYSRVVFGVGSRLELGAELGRLGLTRPLLVSTPSLRAGRELSDLLAALLVGRFDEVAMHVPTDVAARAVAAARATDADSVVVVGGGSAIGTAKALAKDTHLPILAVPTTYAGSEMTPIWGVTDNRRKTTRRDPHVLPRVVIYGPELTVSLPPTLTAASGMNALAHLAECLYAPQVSPLAVLMAQEGIRALAGGLPKVVADPSDINARVEVTYGAWLGGWTLGTTGMGIHHKICHTLGGTYDLPHAPSHSAVIPYALAVNAHASPAAMAAVEAAFLAAGRQVDHAAGAIWDLRNEIGATQSLSALGFPAEEIDAAADIVVQGRPLNPRPVDHACVRAVLAASCAGDRARMDVPLTMLPVADQRPLSQRQPGGL
ncbi:maleylacetate reductase [Streptomyces sp. NPDC050743]|uniref:maleylacetate reductase n=1 Tax=Streptomyces sp. NPDC050743 TaxID=3365634 RepID=UPI0037A35FB7